ncbi:MAG: cupin domain-containing protein [Acidobacteriota bacterium]
MRTPLQDQPISVIGRHGVTARVDIGAGVESGRHMHPGEEFGYVLEGALQLEIDGRAPQTFKPGDVFFVPAGVVHNGRNTGSVKTTFIGTYVVESGKPLSAPAPSRAGRTATPQSGSRSAVRIPPVDARSLPPIRAACVGSRTAGTLCSSRSPPDNEFETNTRGGRSSDISLSSNVGL